MEHDGPLRDALRQVIDKKIGRSSGGLIGSESHGPFRSHDVAHRLPVSGLVDEYEGIDPVVLLIRETVRRGSRAEGRRESRVAGGEFIQLGRLGCTSGTLAYRHQQIAKLFSGSHR